ncbi:MAG: hypothetical protein ACJ763_13895 [Bdellovibrionia bacterium]
MSVLTVQTTLRKIERNMTEIAPHRHPALFSKFLVKGYGAITLSSVTEPRSSDLLQAKLCLGTLITLYDDFADRPSQRDSQLLETLYQFRFGEQSSSVRSLNSCHRRTVDFAQSLFIEMERILNRQPHYRHFIEILNFDLAQFYSANQFSSLLMANPSINNSLENRLYAHHNMGMVIVAMMDLMATERVELSELGAMREVFLLGQRLGRIFNVLATRKREALEGDITGELSTCMSEREVEIAERALRQEISELRDKIRTFDGRITTFSVEAYLDGLAKVHRLHEEMEGVI